MLNQERRWPGGCQEKDAERGTVGVKNSDSASPPLETTLVRIIIDIHDIDGMTIEVNASINLFLLPT